MPLREIAAHGQEALDLATRLLQRCRLADPYAGVFEAADIQWSWRTPRESDDIEKTFWIDDHGPVAGLYLTSTATNIWQIDPLIVPGCSGIEPEKVWARAMEFTAANPDKSIVIPVADDDDHFRQLAIDSGLTATDQDFTGWMQAEHKPELAEIAARFTLVDRTLRDGTPHPMRHRSGDQIAARLKQCSLYDLTLDLAIESPDGQPAGYSLFWFDPVTRVGLIEPVRVHDDYQRKGLARAMVTHGIHRLVAKGAERIKVSWETEGAGALYSSVGFQQQSTTTWYSTPSLRRSSER